MDRAMSALIGCGVGVLLGLGVAAITWEREGELADQRDRLLDQREELRAELDAARRGASRMRERTEELAEELEQTERSGAAMTEAWMKSQAFIHILRLAPPMREICLNDEFYANFHPGWFSPQTSFDLSGGRWFYEEMRDESVITRAAFDRLMKLADGGKSAGPHRD